MTDNSNRTLERIARRVPVPEPAYERLLRRRERKERNRRISAAVLAIVLTLLSITGLMRAFGNAERPATEPTPSLDTGIFSGMGGWIAYGDGYCTATSTYQRDLGDGSGTTGDSETVEPACRRAARVVQRRNETADPQTNRAGSTADDRYTVLNADGSETLLIDARCGYCIAGGSFSPDGSKVVYASGPFDGSGPTGST